MDRIYYFMVAKEETEGGEFPVFRKETGPYEVYYLQISPSMKNNEFVRVKTYMEKGISRILTKYDRERRENSHLVCNIGAGEDTYQVWDRDFEAWLHAGSRTAHWLKTWELPLYQEYKEVHNLMFLLQQIPAGRWPAELIILGETPGMTGWLESLARKMKRITIYAPAQPKEFEIVREALLEEYGLLVQWVRSLQPASREPALVLDYSGKEKIYAWDVTPGSIWIDMMSMETRRHFLEDRETGVYYLSLKSIWRREMQQTLDTMRKIQYNVGVKLSGKVDL